MHHHWLDLCSLHLRKSRAFMLRPSSTAEASFTRRQSFRVNALEDTLGYRHVRANVNSLYLSMECFYEKFPPAFCTLAL